jgi:hypothetical protein
MSVLVIEVGSDIYLIDSSNYTRNEIDRIEELVEEFQSIGEEPNEFLYWMESKLKEDGIVVDYVRQTAHFKVNLY